MAWTLSSWLMSVRAFQLLGALAAAALNGFLTVYIFTQDRGLTRAMTILELLICILLVYTTLAMILQHTGKRSRRKGWLVCFIVFDFAFCAVDVAILTLLARAGLPDHCGGFTPEGFNDETILEGEDWQLRSVNNGFTEGKPGQYGALDRFCGFERSFFIIAAALIFTYILTILFGALSIFETNHVRESKYKEALENLRLEQAKGDVELESAPSPQEETPRHSMPAPPSEGIITRTASLRSTLTSITSSTMSYRPHIIARRPVAQPAAPPLPQRRLSLTKPSSPSGPSFVPIPLDEDSAEAALVTDGMRPGSHSDNSAAGYVADGIQHRPQHRRGASASHGMPMLLEEDQTAESALVSDGMRPEPTLPPYEPGSSQMPGHGGESNDMRLSEYVKGQDRAQDMKDSGRY